MKSETHLLCFFSFSFFFFSLPFYVTQAPRAADLRLQWEEEEGKEQAKEMERRKKKGNVSFLSGSYLSVKIMSRHARVAYHISAMYNARGVVAIWDVDNTL